MVSKNVCLLFSMFHFCVLLIGEILIELLNTIFVNEVGGQMVGDLKSEVGRRVASSLYLQSRDSRQGVLSGKATLKFEFISEDCHLSEL